MAVSGAASELQKGVYCMGDEIDAATYHRMLLQREPFLDDGQKLGEAGLAFLAGQYIRHFLPEEDEAREAIARSVRLNSLDLDELIIGLGEEQRVRPKVVALAEAILNARKEEHQPEDYILLGDAIKVAYGSTAVLLRRSFIKIILTVAKY